MGLLCVANAIVLAAIVLKVYIKLNTRWNNSYVCLVGKTVIVTGANAGLGYATALDFAMRGARVILACRSRERAEGARKKIINETRNENVVVKILDLASFKSVREFANDFNQNESRLDILVNNAGILMSEDRKTEEGYSLTMKVNHLSPFLLTHLLIDKLRSTKNSRIVNMSSYIAKMSELHADEMNVIPKEAKITKGFLDTGTVAYSNSKLCNLLFTIELQKRLQDTDIRVYTVHPGTTKTEIQEKDMSKALRMFIYAILFFVWSAKEGAQTTIYCAVSKEVEGHEGAMYGNCKKLGVYEPAKDVTLARKVWENSEKYVKLAESEKLK